MQGGDVAGVTLHGGLCVYAVSDLHCDYPANVAWVEGLHSHKQQQQKQQPQAVPGSSGAAATADRQQQQLLLSCLIVAGDVSDDLRILRCAGRGPLLLRNL